MDMVLDENMSVSLSPDPLAFSQQGSLSSPTRQRQTPPRKVLGNTSGNQQKSIDRVGEGSAEETQAHLLVSKNDIALHESSPWRVRITVQAEQNHPPGDHPIPQCSPSKVFAERTYTTTVPLKGADETSPTRRRSNGTPRKPRSTPANVKSLSRSPKNTGTKSNALSPAKKGNSTSPAKRGRGRPRKSLNLSEPADQKSIREEATTQHQAIAETKCQDEAYEKDQQRDSRGSWDLADEQQEFDSIMESEGFSMVSTSSLPSVQSASVKHADSGLLVDGPSPFAASPHTTPLVAHGSLAQPCPPKPASASKSSRELDKPISGTPRLARVVRAGIALQGVLSPVDQRKASKIQRPKITSSPLSSGKSPKDRLDDLFNGFGPGTRRELRAGLRLGEELARRQGLESMSEIAEPKVNEDVFGPDPNVHYPELPGPSAGHGYCLKVPDSVSAMSASTANGQLPSPASSELGADDDQMSWEYDSLPQRPSQVPATRTGGACTEYPEDQSSKDDDNMDKWHRENEARDQQERDAVAQHIREADSSQVIVVNSDDESIAVEETMDEDEGDIWQEEAHNPSSGLSTSDIPPIFLQSEAKKPRRSQLPSPWMRKTKDVPSSSPVPNDSDLFWQPSQMNAKPRDTPGRGEYRKAGPVSKVVSNDEHLQLNGETVPGQSPNILNTTLASTDPGDSTYNDEESDDPLSDLDGIDDTLQSQLLDDFTEPLDESTRVDITVASEDLASTPAAAATEKQGPHTPQPPTPSILRTKTLKSKTPKHVRFSTDTSRPKEVDLVAPQVAPLPPAPTSWFSRVTSLLPSWATSTSTAAIPLPPPPKRIIRITELDQGPIPLYMPWVQAHWWALINVWRRDLANPSLYRFDPTRSPAQYLGTTITIKKWAKRITKRDCSIAQEVLRVLEGRGGFEGIEEAAAKGGKSMWGKRPGEWVDGGVVIMAVVCQWASGVQEGVCEVGKVDKAGLRQGSETEVWTKGDLEVDATETVYL